MAKKSSKDIKIEIDDSTGVLQDISAEVLAFNGFSKEALTEEAHGYGAEYVFNEVVGMKATGDYTLTVFWDTDNDTAYTYLGAGTGTNHNHLGDKVTFKVTIGAATRTQEVIIANVNENTPKGELVKCDVTLRAAGALSEA